MKCLRCDWRSDPLVGSGKQQLAEHAADSAHPVCGCCERSLRLDEPVVCEPCLTESRSLLAGVSLMWAELPEHLGQLGSTSYDQRVSSSKEKPLTGGGRLVLAGPGGVGGVPRPLTREELLQPERWWVPGRLGPLTQSGVMDAERSRTGREHVVDNKRTDGVSVAQVLAGWEDDWRHSWGRPAAIVAGGRGGTNATVRSASGYLERKARAAANGDAQFPALDSFPDYLDDLRLLHGRLEAATGRDEREMVAEAQCFECSGRLVRELTDRGYADDWSCQRCAERYDWPRYLLACRAKVQSMPAAGWSLPDHVAAVLAVPEETIRTWVKRGMVAAACVVPAPGERRDKRMRVLFEEVAERVRRRGKQHRKAS